jgi:hypothetical protein
MKTISLIVLLFISTFTFSQSNKFQVGASISYGLSEFRGQTTQFNTAVGISMGAMFQFNVSKLFSIHADLNFEGKGAEYPDDGWTCNNCPQTSTQISLSYLTLPVLARLNFGSKSNFFINAGPYVGYRSSDHNNANNFDFGLTTGLGGQLDLNKNLLLSLELRNNYGLVPSIESYGGKDDLYNNTLNLLLGIAYKLGN